MAVKDINKNLIGTDSKGKNGYATLRDAIKKHKTNLKKITKRDALYLVNKQMEGISETLGNLYIYMFYFAGVDPSGRVNSVEWYKNMRVNDVGAGGTPSTEGTPWCACYTSFCLNFAGITSKGHWNAALENAGTKIGLTTIVKDYTQAKTMDLISFGSHVGFAVLEDSTKPNGYKDTVHVIGGNQGDAVKLNPTRYYSKITGFARSNEYDKEISAGAFLSVLAYFEKANTKTIAERKKEIQARVKSNVTIGSALEKEVKQTRLLLGEFDGYYLGTGSDMKDFIDRFNELTTFETSLESGSIPITQNIAKAQTTSDKNTR